MTSPRLSHEDAVAASKTIIAGERYRFFSTLQGVDGDGEYPALYTGRECVALRRLEVPDVDPETDPMWRVRFDNGVELGVWADEINDFMLLTCQFHGPFAVEYQPGDDPYAD